MYICTNICLKTNKTNSQLLILLANIIHISFLLKFTVYLFKSLSKERMHVLSEFHSVSEIYIFNIYTASKNLWNNIFILPLVNMRSMGVGDNLKGERTIIRWGKLKLTKFYFEIFAQVQWDIIQYFKRLKLSPVLNKK